eukprot:gene11197-15017_t
MRENISLCIFGGKVVLVPYRLEFVARYHEWMKNPYILEMTASEPLTLQEEYQMQENWRDDAKKCTFIVLAAEDRRIFYNTNNQAIQASIDEEFMAGDVNFFLNDRDDPHNAEIEVMIAETKHQRKGFAYEALSLMMYYGMHSIGITRFYAKIHKTNEISLQLFRNLGFAEFNYVEAFEEYEYEFKLDTELNRDIVYSRASHAEVKDYSD